MYTKKIKIVGKKKSENNLDLHKVDYSRNPSILDAFHQSLPAEQGSPHSQCKKNWYNQ